VAVLLLSLLMVAGVAGVAAAAGVAVVVCHFRLRRVHVIDFPAPPPFAAFDIQAQNLCAPHAKHKQK